MLGCYVDDLFTLHSHEGEGTEYARCISALNARWESEDEGEISDLLNMEISREKDIVCLRQSSNIDKLVEKYLPDGVPHSFSLKTTPAGPELHWPWSPPPYRLKVKLPLRSMARRRTKISIHRRRSVVLCHADLSRYRPCCGPTVPCHGPAYTSQGKGLPLTGGFKTPLNSEVFQPGK